MNVYTVHKMHQNVVKALADAVGDNGPTLTQAIIITALAERSGCSQTHLIEATGVDRSTMADVVRRLSKKGYIKRVRNDVDRRAYRITLTEGGKRMADRARKAIDNVNETIAAA